MWVTGCDHASRMQSMWRRCMRRCGRRKHRRRCRTATRLRAPCSPSCASPRPSPASASLTTSARCGTAQMPGLQYRQCGALRNLHRAITSAVLLLCSLTLIGFGCPLALLSLLDDRTRHGGASGHVLQASQRRDFARRIACGKSSARWCRRTWMRRCG